MSKVDWCKTLGWTEEQIEDLRFTGFSYLRQGKYDIALKFFEALCVLTRDSAYDCQTLGALYLQLGNPVKALKVLDKALKIEGEHAPTLLNLTKALFMLGRKDEALKVAEILSREKDPAISNTAKALILAYS